MGNTKSMGAKRAWSFNKGQFVSKVKMLIVYLGMFVGVGLIAFGSDGSNYLVVALGIILAVLGALYRDKRQTTGIVYKERNKNSSPLRKFTLRVTLYGLSALGVGFSVGAWLFISSGVKYFAVYFVIGVIISFVSRYNPRKHKVMAMLEDYFIYFFIFAGVTWISRGVLLILSHPVLGIVLFVVGAFISSSLLLSRESLVFKRKNLITARNFWAVLAIVVGLGFMLNGIVVLLSNYLGYSGQTSQEEVLVGILVFFYGALIALGGSFIHSVRTLVNVKDML